MMVRRCMADLKPGVFDAPLRGCGLPTNSQEEKLAGVTPRARAVSIADCFPIGLRCRCGGSGLPTQLNVAPCSRPSRPLRVATAMAATQPVLTATARCALVLRQVGTEKQPPRPNRETKLLVHRTGRGDPLTVVGMDRTTSVAVEGHKPGQEVCPQRPAGRGANGHVDEARRTWLGTSYHVG